MIDIYLLTNTKMTLEELLNKLIEKGWKPFGKEKKELKFIEIWKEMLLGWEENYYCSKWYSYRELVSKESWLWQFVCENHLYIYKMWENKNFIQDYFKNEYSECCYQYLYDKSCYEYYLLESSLKDESELEDFLLSNIKI